MEIRTTGTAETKRAFARMVEAARRAAPGAVDSVTKRTERQTRAMLSLGWHPPRTPTGSRPGEPPWRISGALSRSVTTERARRSGVDRWAGKVGPAGGGAGTPYGRIQELGGWTGRGHRTHLPARPYLRPAWRVVKPTAHKTFADAWARAAREALR